ncbi:MAG: MarR family transcriptional regulator [Spirochaetota bacterium]
MLLNASHGRAASSDFIQHLFHGQPLLMRRMLGDFEESVTGKRLKRTERRALFALLRTEAMTATALANHLSIEKGALTPLVNRFIRFGYVRKTRSHIDRRAVSITLTPAGRATALRVRAKVHAHIKAKIALLSVSDRRRLRAAVAVMYSLAEKIMLK